MKLCILAPCFPFTENGENVLRINGIARYFKSRGTKYFSFSDPCERICSAIRMSKYREIVINDCGKNESEFDFYMQEIANAFESLLPVKSCFEI